jgi:hypothetical protein
MGAVFCSTCHKLAFTIITENDKMKVIQKGRTLLSTKVGSTINANLKCPDGHTNKLNLGQV